MIDLARKFCALAATPMAPRLSCLGRLRRRHANNTCKAANLQSGGRVGPSRGNVLRPAFPLVATANSDSLPSGQRAASRSINVRAADELAARRPVSHALPSPLRAPSSHQAIKQSTFNNQQSASARTTIQTLYAAAAAAAAFSRRALRHTEKTIAAAASFCWSRRVALSSRRRGATRRASKHAQRILSG